MFTGDNVLGHGTAAVEVLSLWMDTLRQMQSHNCGRGYPAHGEVIADLNAKIAGELGSKHRRERQVLQTLNRIKTEERGKGSVSVERLVKEIYGDTDQQIREQALEPFVDEVLRKLTEDEKVAFEMKNGVKKWFAIDAL